ncbi:response regulator [Pelagibacterium luteolum]|uniref:Response regulator receiver domain-containing protein n=1 Tax=Pelagibacterium luteolum TaxID=440168 RepID=A0A1G7UYL5_9HYPH|nr:response regulator [Pelagibacterium luteolum]SDG52219.1 Response regulator receiver domain-containing protein [Pelagibacterium luteolum]
MSDQFTPYALVADDDALIRLDAVSILEDAGFRVHEANNVEEALAILDAAPASIQLLFTDVHMPPGARTGFDLARECAEKWPHVGILVASGMAKPRPGDLPDGAVFIQKPFSADVVIEHLQNILPDGRKPERLLKRAT